MDVFEETNWVQVEEGEWVLTSEAVITSAFQSIRGSIL